MNDLLPLAFPAIDTPVYFKFESDFVESLRCIPMIVRYKLDQCRLKLLLSHWAQISLTNKTLLAEAPCNSAIDIRKYAHMVHLLVSQTDAAPAKTLPPVDAVWNTLTQIPDSLALKAMEWDIPSPNIFQWQKLHFLERFALVKLSRSSHEGANFPKAMREFGLIL